ncbi:M4 family metallopeptidase [Variovorax terrae]|uniref:Neutral metalloproteinase n=1 Tax=Variovorax terrae TaxID=2923278 RepID=A0A9X2AMV9_9BURK|nr:M4 family metallopeptidase [Variovorax terrae]MCJ0761707.1 M4 family metallopeptidase [Variovorax terrae]
MSSEEVPVYACVCFALPTRVMSKLAERTEGVHRERLIAHIEACKSMRGDRLQPQATALMCTPNRSRNRTLFDARNSTRLPGTRLRKEGEPPVADESANQAYDNTGIALDFFHEVFNRVSLDGQGMHVDSTVHYGRDFTNAMWTGRQMVFGDGHADHVIGFTHSLDITAHELTHGLTHLMVPGGLGVVRKAGKVELQGEAGALNESISDVFASMVKQWHARQSVREANWLVGEGILAPQYGAAIRSLKAPGDRRVTWFEDDQPRDMSGYIDGGDTHTNSGIPNHAFYLAADALGGYSWQTLGPVWYQALDMIDSRTGFRDFAYATLDGAAMIYGPKAREVQATEHAWKKVRVI